MFIIQIVIIQYVNCEHSVCKLCILDPSPNILQKKIEEKKDSLFFNYSPPTQKLLSQRKPSNYPILFL